MDEFEKYLDKRIEIVIDLMAVFQRHPEDLEVLKAVLQELRFTQIKYAETRQVSRVSPDTDKLSLKKLADLCLQYSGQPGAAPEVNYLSKPL